MHSNSFGFSPSQSHPSLPDTLVAGRYRLGMLLGSGSMGTVHLATDMRSGATIALKQLSPELAVGLHAGELRERFRREALVLANLSHPNTVRLIDYGELGNDVYFLAMEYIQGGTLLDMIDKRGALPPAMVVDFGLQLCASLNEAHGKQIIHRDVKPDNVMVQPDLSRPSGFGLKLCDFGVAQLGPGLVAEKLTEAGMTVGTVLYMPPEQAAGLPLTPSTDVYALGCMLYEMLDGEPPFIGSMLQVTHAHSRTPVPELQRDDLTDDQLDQWQDLIEAMMEKRVEDRMSSMRDVAQALQKIDVSTRVVRSSDDGGKRRGLLSAFGLGKRD